jgi:hypothetical protein
MFLALINVHCEEQNKMKILMYILTPRSISAGSDNFQSRIKYSICDDTNAARLDMAWELQDTQGKKLKEQGLSDQIMWYWKRIDTEQQKRRIQK